MQAAAVGRPGGQSTLVRRSQRLELLNSASWPIITTCLPDPQRPYSWPGRLYSMIPFCHPLLKLQCPCLLPSQLPFGPTHRVNSSLAPDTRRGAGRPLVFIIKQTLTRSRALADRKEDWMLSGFGRGGADRAAGAAVRPRLVDALLAQGWPGPRQVLDGELLPGSAALLPGFKPVT